MILRSIIYVKLFKLYGNVFVDQLSIDDQILTHVKIYF